jgi:hypothetical protein
VTFKQTQHTSFIKPCAKTRNALRAIDNFGRRVNSGRQTSVTGLGSSNRLRRMDFMIFR